MARGLRDSEVSLESNWQCLVDISLERLRSTNSSVDMAGSRGDGSTEAKISHPPMARIPAKIRLSVSRLQRVVGLLVQSGALPAWNREPSFCATGATLRRRES